MKGKRICGGIVYSGEKCGAILNLSNTNDYKIKTVGVKRNSYLCNSCYERYLAKKRG